MAVLVDSATRGTPEWLAAVLRQAGAAVLGEATAGAPFLTSRVKVPAWPVEVRMATGWILDPAAPAPRPLGKVLPDKLVTDQTQALDEARELLNG